MWETPFDPSMFDKDVLIFCPDEELAPVLMELLSTYGVMWDMSERLVNNGRNFWDDKKEKTCYRISNKHMGYSHKDYYEREGRYRNYIKCTFYGEPESTFEPANDSELLAFLGL